MVFEWSHDDNILAERITYQKLAKEPDILVKEYECALIIYQGKIYDEILPGKYQLLSRLRVIPLLSDIIEKVSSTRIDVVYVDLKDLFINWGGGNWITKDNVNIGAHGELFLKISDPKSFLINLIGSNEIYSKDKLKDSFGGPIKDIFRRVVTNYPARNLIVAKDEYEQPLHAELKTLCNRWGFELLSWTADWNVPDEIRNYWEVTTGLKGTAESEELKRKLDLEGTVRDFARTQELHDLDIKIAKGKAGVALLQQVLETTDGYDHKLRMETMDKLKDSPELAQTYLEGETLKAISEKGEKAAARAADAIGMKHKKPLSDLHSLTIAPNKEDITLRHINLEGNKKNVGQTCSCGAIIQRDCDYCPKCGRKIP